MRTGASCAVQFIHLNDRHQRHRTVDVGERRRGIAQLFVDDLNANQCFVDVEEKERVDVAVEALAHLRPLGGGAAVDEALVGQFDATRRTGVHAFVQGSGPTVRFGEVVDHRP